MLDYLPLPTYNTTEHYSDLRAKIAVMSDPEAINKLVRAELFEAAKRTLVPNIRGLSSLLLEIDVYDIATVVANSFFEEPSAFCDWECKLHDIVTKRDIAPTIAAPWFEAIPNIIAEVKTHVANFSTDMGLVIMYDLSYLNADGVMVVPVEWEAVEARLEALAEPLGVFKAVRELGLRMLVPRLKKAAPFLTAGDAGTLALQILDNYFKQFAKTRYANTYELMCRNRGALNGEFTLAYPDLEVQHVIPVFAKLDAFLAKERLELILPAEYPVINFAEDVVDLYKLAVSI